MSSEIIKMENNNVNKQNIFAAIEAILFVYGEPLAINKIAKLLKRDPKLRIHPNASHESEKEFEEFIRNHLEELNQQYQVENRGLRLIFNDNRIQLVTKPEFCHLLLEFVKEEFKENLTPAALETISLIAYFGPISRAKIDYFRGVNSSFTLRSLLMRGLIERLEDKKEHGGYLYQLSFDSLKHLGIEKIEDLPEFEKYKNLAAYDTARTKIISETLTETQSST